MAAAQLEKVEKLKPALLQLERHEKLVVIQWLVTKLAEQEEALLAPNSSYTVWSPLEAYSASDALLQLLANPQTETHE